MKATDPNVIAKSIVDAATAEEKNPAAVALGRLGGLKGGRARVGTGLDFLDWDCGKLNLGQYHSVWSK